MGASPDFMNQILSQAGLTGQQPQGGGLLGSLNQALAPYGGSTGLALSLMANRSGATAPGAALAQGMQNAQQLQLDNLSKRLQIAQMAMQLPALAFRAKTLNDLSNPAQQSQDASANPASPQASDTQNLPPPLIRNYNAPAQFGASQQSQPTQPTASPYDQPIVFNGRPMSAQDYQRMLMAFGETPDVAQQKARAEQLAQAQMRIRPQLSVLDPIINSATNPAAIIQNNAMARQAWQLGAQQYGYTAADLSDPVKVRQALAAGRNLMAASAELPAINAPERLEDETVNGVKGQRNPITNKFEPERVSAIDEYNFAKSQGYKGTFTDWKLLSQQNPTNTFSDKAQQLLASFASAGVSLPAGLRSRQQQVATVNGLLAKYPDKTTDEIADMVRTGQLDFNGAKRSTGQMATLAAAADIQATKLEKDFAQLEPLVAKLPNAPSVVNRALVGLKQNLAFGGDKDSAALVTYLREAATEYAKLSSGSTGSAAPAEGNIKESVGIFQNAFTQGGYQGLKEAILQSAQNKREAVREGLQRASQPGESVGAGPAPSSSGNLPVMTPEQARSAPKGTRFKTTDGRIMVRQ